MSASREPTSACRRQAILGESSQRCSWPTARALLLAALAASAPLSLSSQTNIDVRFGILVAGGGPEAFMETQNVPNVAGQAFGWIATLPANPSPVPWSEELNAPAAPLVWNGADVVSTDRKSALSRGTIEPGQTQFSHFWTVTPGDPSGAYTLEVKVYDGTIAEFQFELR
jgi:hypothetical protein